MVKKNKKNIYKNIMDREPDFENESLKMWKSDKKESKKLKKEYEKEGGLEVTYKDMTLKLMGFSEVKDNKNKEVIFAFKVKSDKNMILYYVNPNIKDDDKEKIDAIIKLLELNPFGFSIQNTEDFLKNIYNEKHRFINDKKKK